MQLLGVHICLASRRQSPAISRKHQLVWTSPLICKLAATANFLGTGNKLAGKLFWHSQQTSREIKISRECLWNLTQTYPMANLLRFFRHWKILVSARFRAVY